ncbi:hypothetical protein ANCCAN_04281 [Ancylostoma caninum]|uniref:Uncharacterized protein n=1 Tax=Ancylostoma caninum TaxID=29170 RepID=A0A368H325_ANCCA|nr:hypothetical protein ANCCAN_04281 [Ancylostoma caninum]
MASAPYDMAMITENCKRAKKSPYMLRDLPLVEKTIGGWQIIGHTVILTRGFETVACATIILPGLPLLRASFHAPPVEGHIHIIPFKDMQARILPDLKYSSEYENDEPQKALIEWAFVQDCDRNMNSSEVANGNELGVDSRSTLTVQIPKNYTFRFFALFVDNKLFTCSPIGNVEIRQIRRGRYILSQVSFFPYFCYMSNCKCSLSGFIFKDEVHMCSSIPILL